MAFNQQQYQEQQLAHPNQTGGFLIPRPACTVLCCNCGRPMDGTQGTVMCTDCIELRLRHYDRNSSRSYCYFLP